MAVFRINFEAVNDYPALAFRPRVVSEVLRRHALSDQNAFLGLSSNRPAQQHRSEGLVTLIGGPLSKTSGGSRHRGLLAQAIPHGQKLHRRLAR
jgi:hypothetical protein